MSAAGRSLPDAGHGTGLRSVPSNRKLAVPGHNGAVTAVSKSPAGIIVTGEAVLLDLRVARLGSRALALLVDWIVQLILFFMLTTGIGVLVAMAYAVGIGDPALYSALMIITVALVLIGYPTAMHALTGGRTIGKLALGLRVVRDDGGPIGFRHALTRTLVGVAVEFPAIILPFGGWVLSVVSMTASPTSQRIGDHAAGTFVIHERNLQAWGWVPSMPWGLAPWASTLDLAGMSDELALAVRHFLARSRRLREPARSRLGRQLAQEVAQVTSPPPPAGTPDWAYLAAVHAERHARAMRRLAANRARADLVWPELAAAVRPASTIGRGWWIPPPLVPVGPPVPPSPAPPPG